MKEAWLMVLLTKSQKNIFILKSNQKYVIVISYIIEEEIKISVILPLVGGFVEGGMVEGANDKRKLVIESKSTLIM